MATTNTKGHTKPFTKVGHECEPNKDIEIEEAASRMKDFENFVDTAMLFPSEGEKLTADMLSEFFKSNRINPRFQDEAASILDRAVKDQAKGRKMFEVRDRSGAFDTLTEFLLFAVNSGDEFSVNSALGNITGAPRSTANDTLGRHEKAAESAIANSLIERMYDHIRLVILAVYSQRDDVSEKAISALVKLYGDDLTTEEATRHVANFVRLFRNNTRLPSGQGGDQIDPVLKLTRSLNNAIDTAHHLLALATGLKAGAFPAAAFKRKLSDSDLNKRITAFFEESNGQPVKMREILSHVLDGDIVTTNERKALGNKIRAFINALADVGLIHIEKSASGKGGSDTFRLARL